MPDEISPALRNQDYLVVEALIKLAAIERLLIKSGAIKADDLVSEIKLISAEIVKSVADTAAKQVAETYPKA